MGEETTVKDVQDQIRNDVEMEENQDQQGNTAKAMALGAAALAAMAGAGYGLYRLGKVAVQKFKEHKAEQELLLDLDDFDDEFDLDEPEEKAEVAKK